LTTVCIGAIIFFFELQTLLRAIIAQDVPIKPKRKLQEEQKNWLPGDKRQPPHITRKENQYTYWKGKNKQALKH
jgi:hypothetical protein